MWTIVSNDTRIPLELSDLQINKCNFEEFLKQAFSDEGMDVDEGVWFDVSCLTPDIYKTLSAHYKNTIKVLYYRFADVPKPNFRIMNTKVIKA